MFVSPCGKVHPPAFIVLRADCSVWLDLVVIRVDGPRGVRFKILSFRLQTANGPRSTDFEVCVIFDESLLRYCAAYVWLVAIALNCDFDSTESPGVRAPTRMPDILTERQKCARRNCGNQNSKAAIRRKPEKYHAVSFIAHRQIADAGRPQGAS